jgi:hypothetical protein
MIGKHKIHFKSPKKFKKRKVKIVEGSAEDILLYDVRSMINSNEPLEDPDEIEKTSTSVSFGRFDEIEVRITELNSLGKNGGPGFNIVSYCKVMEWDSRKTASTLLLYHSVFLVQILVVRLY